MVRNYSDKTLKQLFGLAGNQCAFPDCTQGNITENGIIGIICHIEGLKPDSARHNTTLTETESNDYPNLIVLCPTHHRIIDTDKLTYTVEILKKMKKDHEDKFRDNQFEVTDELIEKLHKFQEQVNIYTGSGNQNITQFGDVNVGLTSIDDADKLFQLLFERNFPKLREEATIAARQSAEDYCKTFIHAAKRKLDSNKIERLSDPDIQAGLTESIMEAGRKNDKELHDHLSRLVIERIKNDDNDLKKIFYNEAIKTIGKLTINQLKIITTCLLLRYVTQDHLTSLEGFDEYVKKFILPFLDFKATFADFQHIEYAACGSSMGVGSWSFIPQIKNGYPQFRHYKISSEDAANLNLPNKIQNDLFELNQESSLEFKFKERKALDEYLATQSLDNRAKIQEKFEDSRKVGDDNWTEFIDKSESIQKALKAIENTRITSLSLTSIGFIIAIMYYEKVTGDTISLEGWIS